MARNNKVTLIGRLGQDPFVNKKDEKYFMAFSLATNESYPEYDKEGNVTGWKQSKTEWHNVLVFDSKQVDKYAALTKGELLKVEGQIKYRPNKENKNISEASIIASSITTDV